MSSRGSMQWDIGANNSKFKRVMRDTRADAKKTAGRVKGTLSKMGGGVLGALGVGAMTAMAKQTIDLGSKLSDMATQTMTGVEAFQVLESSAREAGVATETMQRGLRNININSQKAAEGVKTQADAMERLGIDTEKFNKLPTELKMEELGKAYANATDKQAAYLDVSSILGAKAGPEMIEVLETLSRDGFDEVAKSARNAGEVMDEHTVMMLDRTADSIERTKRKIQVGIGGILEDFSRFGDDGLKNILFKILSLFGRFGGMLLDAWLGIWQRVGSVASAILSQVRKMLFSAIEGIINGINKIPGINIDTSKIKEAREDIKGFREELDKNMMGEKTFDFSSQFGDFWKEKSDAINENRAEEYAEEKAKTEGNAELKAFASNVEEVEEEKAKVQKKAAEKVAQKFQAMSRGSGDTYNVASQATAEEQVLSDGSRIVTKRIGDETVVSQISKTGNSIVTDKFITPEAAQRKMLQEALVGPLEKLIMINAESNQHLSVLSGIKTGGIPSNEK